MSIIPKTKGNKIESSLPVTLKNVYVFLTQALSPLVNLIENNVLMIEDYQWLCDSL